MKYPYDKEKGFVSLEYLRRLAKQREMIVGIIGGRRDIYYLNISSGQTRRSEKSITIGKHKYQINAEYVLTSDAENPGWISVDSKSLRALLNNPRMQSAICEIQDYIQVKTESGYRSIPLLPYIDAETEHDRQIDVFAAGYSSYIARQPCPSDTMARQGWYAAWHDCSTTDAIIPEQPEGYYHAPIGTFD